MVSVETQRAEKLLTWLDDKWHKPQIGMTDLLQYGPNSLRQVDRMRGAMHLLANYGWVVLIPGGAVIDGKRHKEAWEIIKNE